MKPLSTKAGFALSGQIIMYLKMFDSLSFSHSSHQFYHQLETAGENIFHFALKKGKLTHQYETKMSNLP